MGKRHAWSFKNRNVDMPLIVAKGGRFPWARLQSLRLLLRKARRKKDFLYLSVQSLPLALFPLESPPATPINRIAFKKTNNIFDIK
ncbi:hypothetical protein MKY29_02490 [Psychrobacillus sp. FSL K6-2365]|uniref:hypothetical protein n=1 Tax=Psychrobacillus sp. FSL K6-2365 TaxID=2921546 RepID=UPI0030FC9D24